MDLFERTAFPKDPLFSDPDCFEIHCVSAIRANRLTLFEACGAQFGNPESIRANRAI